MFAAEFDANVRDGSIEIPEDVLVKLPKRVRVIVLASPESEIDDGSDLISELLANPLHVPGFIPLSRNEAHGR